MALCKSGTRSAQGQLVVSEHSIWAQDRLVSVAKGRQSCGNAGFLFLSAFCIARKYVLEVSRCLDAYACMHRHIT